MLGSHGHAHYLPSADPVAPRRLTHLTVFAPDGFGPAEVAVLSGLRCVQVGDADPLRVQLVGLGVPGDFRHELFGPARVWESATPFVGPAHVGRQDQERSLRKALRRELRRLAQHGLLAESALAGVRIAVWTPSDGPRALEFRRQRARPGDDGARRPCGLFRLEFDREIPGPLGLGHASHFGLGRFRAVAGSASAR